MGSCSVGIGNLGGGNPNSWVGTDPIFEVGNGYVDGEWVLHQSDALEVYKNGNVTVSGTLTVQPGGDIPMFSGD
jgi:hypothetical protein